MNKREATKLAKAAEKDLFSKITELNKGSGWKKKHMSFFKEIDGNFYCALVLPKLFIIDEVPVVDIRVRFEAKPMSIDPIYWDIVQLPGNKEKPLSFRAWAAFKCQLPMFVYDEPIHMNERDFDVASAAFVRWREEELLRVESQLNERDFVDILSDFENVSNRTDKFAIEKICAYISNGKQQEALKIARRLAPDTSRPFYFDNDRKQRVNFFELTILYLEGL